LTFYAELEMGETPIAAGASGKVYKGTLHDESVAIKVFSEDMLSFSLTEFQREVAIMR
jgi:predicted unusual protein kinase regulating ubiquinone biosynthesis (AarF/ABC1/UbiB family)